MYWILTDGIRAESFYPNITGYSEPKEILVDRSRSYVGKSYNYVIGSVNKWKFDVSFVDSSQKYILNYWWANRTTLSFTSGLDTSVNTVFIANSTKPIARNANQYTTLFHGSFLLEAL